MTVMEFIAIVGFASLFLSAGIAIGRFVENYHFKIKATAINSSQPIAIVFIRN